MKLKPLCDCEENKIVTGQIDGEMIWRLKDSQETVRYNKNPMFSHLHEQTVTDMSHTWKGDKDKEWEAYQANAN